LIAFGSRITVALSSKLFYTGLHDTLAVAAFKLAGEVREEKVGPTIMNQLLLVQVMSCITVQ